MRAEIAVARVEQGLEFVEGQLIVHRESAHDAEPHPLVDQAVESGAVAHARGVAGYQRRASAARLTGDARVRIVALGGRRSIRHGSCARSEAENDVQDAEPHTENRHMAARAASAKASDPRATNSAAHGANEPHGARDRHRARREHGTAVEQQPGPGQQAARCPRATARRSARRRQGAPGTDTA